MLYNGKVIGKSEKPLYDAARWLLSNNAASESDTLATFRGGTLSMHGIVGDLAQWTVVENRHGNPSLELRRWRPFSASTVFARTALFDVLATEAPVAARGDPSVPCSPEPAWGF